MAPFSFLFFALLAGAVLDFFVVGVFKLIWFIVYIPFYLVVGKVFFIQISHTKWNEFGLSLYGAILVGALVARLVFVGSHGQISYSMAVTGLSPITLTSKLWPQSLIVSSEPLRLALASRPMGAEVPVQLEYVSDYGCIRNFSVSSVDSVDLLSDRAATWVWKLDTRVDPGEKGPGKEDQRFPWCWYHFYLGV